MSLGEQAEYPLCQDLVPATCHVATWCWAARVARRLNPGWTAYDEDIINNISRMNPPPERAILALPRSGTWDFTITKDTPSKGTVLLWPMGATHSAIVMMTNKIAGYNQGVRLPEFARNFGYTVGTPDKLAADQKVCELIADATIVNAARSLGL